MKILILNDFGTNGYAQSLKPHLRFFSSLGHEVLFLAKGYDSDRFPNHGFPCRVVSVGGNILQIVSYVDQFQPDLVLCPYELWLNPFLASYGNAYIDGILQKSSRRFIVLAYPPFEFHLSGGFLNSFSNALIHKADISACWSKYAHDSILRTTGFDVPCIPLTVDTDIFKPKDKREIRNKYGIPQDAFIIGMIAGNSGRKRWEEFFSVSSCFIKKYPKIRILPWTGPWPNSNWGGYDISDFIYRFGLEDCVVDIRSSLTEDIVRNNDFMGELYNLMDFHVLTTSSEGTGLPSLEARACGIPSLVSANTANIESVGHPFELIPSYESSISASISSVFPLNTIFYQTNLDELEKRMERLYLDSAFREEVGRASHSASKKYSIANVMPAWEKLLRYCEEISNRRKSFTALSS